MEERRFYVGVEETEEGSSDVSHPWTQFAVVRYPPRRLVGQFTRLARTGVSRLPPGKESFAYNPHRSYRKEEWIYVVSDARGFVALEGEGDPVRPTFRIRARSFIPPRFIADSSPRAEWSGEANLLSKETVEEGARVGRTNVQARLKSVSGLEPVKSGSLQRDIDAV